ncbi:hypothetical protein O3M35_001171 [Rhynocoris fuscipes]|uniref:Transducin beta-like protein 2 n=1 Tax=Rhynocoris fuscipes TaxID=488301 RepID=A0AAW1DU15_9HEMI
MDSSHITAVLQKTLVPLIVRYLPIFVTLILAWITVNELYFKKQVDNKKGEQPSEAPPQKAERKPVVPSVIKPPKKKQSTEKWNRDGKQNFSHEWLLTSLKGHSGAIMDMEFSANGKFLATCADDRAIFVWSTKHWKDKDHKYIRYNIDYDHASLIRWSPDSKAFIYNRYSDNTIEVCKLIRKPDGWIASLSKALTYPKAHNNEIIGMGIDPNGKYIMTCSAGTDMIIWDLKGAEITKVETYLMNNYAAKVSPCGTFVAVSGFAPDVKVWEVQFNKTGEFKQVCRAFELTGHTSGIFDFAFNADSSLIATVSKDRTWKLFNIKIQYTKGEDPHLLKSGKFNTSGKDAFISLSPDGQVICLACESTLTIINALTGEVDKVIQNVYPGPIRRLAFDAAGEYILTAGDKHVRIFHNVTGYKAAILASKMKLQSSGNSSATKERLEKTIEEAQAFLQSIESKTE